VSATSQTQASTGWFKQNSEKVVLLVVLVALLASAVILMARIQAEKALINDSGRPVVQTPGGEVQPIDLNKLAESKRRIAEPLQVTPLAQRLFMSEVRVTCVSHACAKPIPYAVTKCPFCGTEQPTAEALLEQDSDGDLIPDVTEVGLGMDPFNPADAEYDLDGDGFSALDEYRFKTDSKNKESHPPFVARLRFDRVITVPFRFRFVAVQEIQTGVLVFQLNVRTLDQTYFKKVGDTVEGFLVSEYLKDEDTLVLTKGDRTVRLKRGVEIIDDLITVRFAFLIDRVRPEGRLGQTFDLRGTEYRIEKDMPAQKARIVRTDTGETFEIEPMTDAERRLMDSGTGSTAVEGVPVPAPR
jgi:hypothetical protein